MIDFLSISIANGILMFLLITVLVFFCLYLYIDNKKLKEQIEELRKENKSLLEKKIMKQESVDAISIKNISNEKVNIDYNERLNIKTTAPQNGSSFNTQEKINNQLKNNNEKNTSININNSREIVNDNQEIINLNEEPVNSNQELFNNNEEIVSSMKEIINSNQEFNNSYRKIINNAEELNIDYRDLINNDKYLDNNFKGASHPYQETIDKLIKQANSYKEEIPNKETIHYNHQLEEKINSHRASNPSTAESPKSSSFNLSELINTNNHTTNIINPEPVKEYDYLQEISNRLNEELKPQTIELTDYEKKQEEQAVISDQELLKFKSSNSITPEKQETINFIEELKSFRNSLK